MTYKTALAIAIVFATCIGVYIATRPPSPPFVYTPAVSDGRLLELRDGPAGQAMSARAFYHVAGMRGRFRVPCLVRSADRSGAVTDHVYFTTDDPAERLRMTPGALRNWRYRNEGPPFVKFGKRVLYYLPDVIKWEQQQRATER